MRHVLRLIVMATLTLLATTTLAAPAADAKPADKVAVCHLGDDGSYHLINVSANAQPALLARGDAMPGDPVPGLDSSVFDDTCTPIASYTTIDFEEASSTVGDSFPNSAGVSQTINDLLPGEIFILIEIFDTDQASDDGYTFFMGNTFTPTDGGQTCALPITQVRGRTELNGEVYRVDFDGYQASGVIFTDLPGPFELPDQPTLIVESIALDLSGPCD